jgi:hypothetical protein
MKLLAILALSLSSAGCSGMVLDFGGDDKKPFEFNWGWERGVTEAGPENPATPGFDKDGNKIVPAEVANTYTFPAVHAGVDAEAYHHAGVTPSIGMTAFEFKVPYARWFSVQPHVGADLVDIYVGKRLTSIYEITIGPWFGRNFKDNEWCGGIGLTIIKF